MSPRLDVQRGPRICHQIADDDVIFGETPLHRNRAQQRLEDVLLIGKFFDFAIGYFWGIEHRQRDHLCTVAHQNRPLFFCSLHRQLDSSLYVQFGNFLQHAAALLILRIRQLFRRQSSQSPALWPETRPPAAAAAACGSTALTSS